MHTPTIFLHLNRACGIYYDEHQDIAQVKPPEDKKWNDWLHRTKNGCPYMVLERDGMRFSVSRRRRNNRQWGYLVRWPYPSEIQKKAACNTADQVAELIRRETLS